MTTQAQAVMFNFEEFAATRTGVCPTGGTLASLSSTKAATGTFSGASEVTMTLQVVKVPELNLATGAHGALGFDNPNGTRLRLDVREKWTKSPPSFGNRTLDPTCDNPTNGNDDDVWVLANFSEPLDSISMDVTDAGFYPDALKMYAYAGQNAGGAMRGATNATFMGENPAFLTASLVLEGGFFHSVLFRANDDHVLRGDFTDNINVTLAEIPEPSAGMLGGFTIGALAAAAALTKRS